MEIGKIISFCIILAAAGAFVQTLIEVWISARHKPKPMNQQTGRFLNAFHPDGTVLDAYEFSSLFELLADAPKPYVVQSAAEEALRLYHSLEPREMTRIFMDTGKDWRHVEPSLWQKHCRSEESYYALLCVATTHRCGYLREKALMLLPEEGFALPFVLMRLNDWAPPVRSLAMSMLPRVLANASPQELVQAMPYFDGIIRGRRLVREERYDAQGTELMVLRRLTEDPACILSMPFVYRRSCYQMLLRAQWEDDFEWMTRFWMCNEPDGMQRDLLHRHFLRNMRSIDPEELRNLCKASRWRIRLEAMERRFREEGLWDGFEMLLLDRSAPVREFAAYHLEREEFDCLAFCRGNLPAALLALSELGTKDDIPAIRERMDSNPRECLVALVRLEATDANELLWQAMHSQSPSLAKTAYRMARARHVRFDTDRMLAEIQSDADPQLRWRLFRLLNDWGDWRLLPTLIRMVRDYAHLRPDMLTAIEKRSPNCQSISPALADEITKAIDYAGVLLPEQLAASLRFDLKRLT